MSQNSNVTGIVAFWTGAPIEHSAAKQTYVNPPDFAIARFQRIRGTAATGNQGTLTWQESYRTEPDPNIRAVSRAVRVAYLLEDGLGFSASSSARSVSIGGWANQEEGRLWHV